MSDVIKRKIGFPHPMIQIQGLEKLVNEIRKKHKIDSKGHLYENEIESLWRYCYGESTDNALLLKSLCVESLVQLVRENILSANVSLKTAVNYASSVTEPNHLVDFIYKLLQMQINECHKSSKDVKIQFKLRSPPHPFVSVLSSNNHSFTPICDVIFHTVSCLNDKNEEEKCLEMEMIKVPLIFVCSDQSNVKSILNELMSVLQSHFNKEDVHVPLLTTIYNILIMKELTPADANAYLCFLRILKGLDHQVTNSMSWELILKLCEFIKNCSSGMSTVLLAEIQSWVSLFDDSYYTSLFIMSLSDIIPNANLEINKRILKVLYHIVEIIPTNDVNTYIALLTLHSSIINCMLLAGNPMMKLLKTDLYKLCLTLEGKLQKCQQSLNNFTSRTDATLNIDKYTANLALKLHFYCSVIADSFVLKASVDNLEITEDDWMEYCNASTISILHKTKNDDDIEELDSVLKFVQKFTKKFPQAALNIVPVILYCLKTYNESDKMLSLLYTLPNVAHHTFCLPIVVNTLRSFAKVPSMLPLVIRLMFDLWKIHDKCFPSLQKMIISGNLKLQSINEELQVVQCTTIHEVCLFRPHQHTSEVLQLLTSIINLSDKQSVQAAIAVDGLRALCANQALDIVSTWNTLLKNIWLKCGGPVVASILELLSLAQELDVETEAYKEFKVEVLNIIWSKVTDQNPLICTAAIEALSQMDSTEFTLHHLPTTVKPPQDETEVIEEAPIPGFCYLNLMLSLPSKTYPYFKILLSSLLRQEMEQMPRDIHHRAMRHQRSTSQPQHLDDIPSYILKMYEKNKQPNIKANLALALLISHNPINPVGADGKTIYRLSASRGKRFFQLLLILLGEVNLDPNDWQGLLWVMIGWENFMERCLNAMVEGRKAELEMQLENNTKDSKLTADEVEEIQNKQFCAHLWCRDKVMQELVNGSKGSPAKQGNCVIALSALASACIKIEKKQQQSSQETRDTVQDSVYVGNNHWILKVADTLMCIADEQFKPSGRIFSWCQYNAVSQTGKLSSTQLGRICAFHGFPQVLDALFPKHTVKILNMLDLLFTNAFPMPNASGGMEVRSSNISRHSAISLGKFWAILIKQKYQDSLSNEAEVMHSECLEKYLSKIKSIKEEDATADEVLENSDDIGAVVGFGYFASAEIYYGENPNYKTDILLMLLPFIQCIEDPEGVSQTYINALCFTTSLLCASGSTRNLIDEKLPSKCLQTILKRHEIDSNQLGIAQALGTLANSLFFSGSETIMQQIISLHSKWNKALADSRTSLRVKIASLIGISCLAGSNNALLPATQNPDLLTNVQYKTVLNNVTKILKFISGNQNNSGLQGNAILLLSHMALSYEHVSKAQSEVIPPTYSYLPETSVLKYTFNLLAEIGKKNPNNQVIPEVLLSAIFDISKSFTLPPINIATYFNIFCNTENVAEAVLTYSVSIALNQSCKSQSSVAFISNWISAPVFHSLSTAVKLLVYQNLDVIITTQPISKLETLLSWMYDNFVTNPSVGLEMLKTTKKCLKMQNMSTDALASLHAAVEKFYHGLQFDICKRNWYDIWCMIADCLSCHPKANEIVKDWKKKHALSDEHKNSVLKTLFIRCYCTKTGLHPISLCNNIIEESSKLDLESQKVSLWVISITIGALKYDTKNSKSQIDWIQELMGFIRQTSLKTKNMEAQQVLEFLLRVLATTITCWINDNHNIGVPSVNDGDSSLEQLNFLWRTCGRCLPRSLEKILNMKKWNQITNLSSSFIEWLIFLHNNMRPHDDMVEWRLIIKQSIINMRTVSCYKRPSVWMEAANVLHEL